MTKTRAEWPGNIEYRKRFRVEDLVPSDRSRIRWVFIGESPHRDEVAPENPEERSPFRGVAGREWWSEVAVFLREPIPTRPVPSRRELLRACEELGIAVLNAVNYPIDPKITMHYGPGSDPGRELGFQKGAGPLGYRAIHKVAGEENPLRIAIRDLARRLRALERTSPRIVCLGGDSKWLTEKALELLPESSALRKQPLATIPHPSSWWRNMSYRERAVEFLREALGKRPVAKGLVTAPSTARRRTGSAS